MVAYNVFELACVCSVLHLSQSVITFPRGSTWLVQYCRHLFDDDSAPNSNSQCVRESEYGIQTIGMPTRISIVLLRRRKNLNVQDLDLQSKGPPGSAESFR